MWSEGRLAAKDQELKHKRKIMGQAMMVEEPHGEEGDVLQVQEAEAEEELLTIVLTE